MVISFHYVNNQLVNTQTAFGKIVYNLTSFGWVGVDLFFVISGFLIGSILLRHQVSGKLFKTFYLRRFLRIVPNYYLLILIFIIISQLSFFKGDYFLTGNKVIPIWSYFAMTHNFFMADLQNMGNDAMSVTWSIGIEEQFYILFPLFILLIKEKWLPYFLIVLIGMAIYCRSLYTHWIPAYVLLPCRMDAISFGILLAWLHKNYDVKLLVQKHVSKMLVSVGLVILICAYLFYFYRDLGIVRNSLFAFVFFILILISLGKPQSHYVKLLSNKWLGRIGMISYSLYLFHYLILGVFRNLGTHFYTAGGTAYNIGVSITALLVSFFFAWLVYQFLEKPFVALGKKFKYS